MPTAWMVRGAGGGSNVIQDFEQAGCVAIGCAVIGWQELADLSGIDSTKELRRLVEEANPEKRPAQVGSTVGQVARFRFDMKPGGPVLSYDPEKREYLIGEMVSGYEYKPGQIEERPHVRRVKWKGRVGRDGFSAAARNTLGSIMTIFDVGGKVWNEATELLKGKPAPPTDAEAGESGIIDIREEVLGRSHEFIKDLVQKLDWDEMQDLVAGILRAMGYKTRVSPPGSDRGKDIVASPDGLGLEQPRIRVEVKHRPKQQMGAPEIRSFIGALRQSDKGLYVSTGGFTKEARYEAERAPVPVTLLDLDDLVALLVQHYEDLDTETRALVPLSRVYWPAQ